MKSSTRILTSAVLVIAAGTVWHAATLAQPTKPPAAIQSTADGSRFVFEVVESFNAKYQGDTPGHTGRGGGLAETRPNVALGDPVYRGDKHIGQVTGLVWDRVRGSLTVEFDPVPLERIAVGDTIWIKLDSTPIKADGKSKK